MRYEKNVFMFNNGAPGYFFFCLRSGGCRQNKIAGRKVEMLTNQLGLDKVDTLADPAEAKKTLNEKYEEKLEKIKSKIPFDISGSVDVYVQTNFNGKQTNSVSNRAFYTKANSFELGMVNLILKKKVKKVGFVADLGFGPRAEAANNTLYSNTILAIKQLYVSYAPADWVELTLGNFSTFFGYELIEPQNNFNYSTSLAFQNGPFYHTGFKANFTVKNGIFLRDSLMILIIRRITTETNTLEHGLGIPETTAGCT